jgi:hypothetical protein
MRRQWNLASWRKVHWSDESRFLLHVTDDRVCVWRQPNTAYAERNIVETVPFGGCSVMVWGCVSYNCKLDLITVRGNLNGQIYRQTSLKQVLCLTLTSILCIQGLSLWMTTPDPTELLL